MNLFLVPTEDWQERAARSEPPRRPERRAVHLDRHRVQGRYPLDARKFRTSRSRHADRPRRDRPFGGALLDGQRRSFAKLEQGGVPCWFGTSLRPARRRGELPRRPAQRHPTRASVVKCRSPSSGTTPYPREILTRPLLARRRRRRWLIPIAAGGRTGCLTGRRVLAGDRADSRGREPDVRRVAGVASAPRSRRARRFSRKAEQRGSRRLRRAMFLAVGGAAVVGGLLGAALAIAPAALRLPALPVLSSIARPTGPAVALSAALGAPGWNRAASSPRAGAAHRVPHLEPRPLRAHRRRSRGARRDHARARRPHHLPLARLDRQDRDRGALRRHVGEHEGPLLRRLRSGRRGDPRPPAPTSTSASATLWPALTARAQPGEDLSLPSLFAASLSGSAPSATESTLRGPTTSSRSSQERDRQEWRTRDQNEDRSLGIGAEHSRPRARIPRWDAIQSAVVSRSTRSAAAVA